MTNAKPRTLRTCRSRMGSCNADRRWAGNPHGGVGGVVRMMSLRIWCSPRYALAGEVLPLCVLAPLRCATVLEALLRHPQHVVVAEKQCLCVLECLSVLRCSSEGVSVSLHLVSPCSNPFCPCPVSLTPLKRRLVYNHSIRSDKPSSESHRCPAWRSSIPRE